MIVGIWIALTFLNAVVALNAIRYYQRGGYRFREYREQIPLKDYAIGLSFTAVGVGASLALTLAHIPSLEWCGIAVMYAGLLLYELISIHHPPYRSTARAKRLYIVTVVYNAVVCALICTVTHFTSTAAWAAFLPLTTWGVVPLAGRTLNSYEQKENDRFKQKAKAKLVSVHPTVIGVTGSYGKTSFKSILSDILSVRYHVCASPESYNTEMGLCLTINNYLKDDDEILIAEMGARYSGDIRKLTEIAAPNLTVITGIGTQHMSTFGSKQALEDTKYELVSGMRKDGTAFFAADEGSARLCARGMRRSVSVTDTASPYYVAILNAEVDSDGSVFDLVTYDGSVRVKTCLIGQHNLANIRLACTVALYMGLTAEEIAKGVGAIKAIPHRLQLLPKSGALQVIDDSYNASMEGVRAAAEALALFPHNRAVITPGIIEAGKDSELNNFRAGCMFAGVAETVFVYGPNKAALIKGLHAGGLRDIRVVRGRDEAVKMVKDLVGLRVLLFSNDLPR